jgi:hypothetical protein
MIVEESESARRPRHPGLLADIIAGSLLSDSLSGLDPSGAAGAMPNLDGGFQALPSARSSRGKLVCARS